MKTTELKICGVKDSSNLRQFLFNKAVSYIGCIHFEDSSRHVSLLDAKRIFEEAREIKPEIQRVIVMVNPKKEYIEEAMRITSADILQLAGNESSELVDSLDLYSIWKVVHVSTIQDLDKMSEYINVARYVLDTKKDGSFGGSGERFDIDIFLYAKKITKKLVIAGGISADNIFDVLYTSEPEIVDVSSLVEISPGLKDPYKVEIISQAIESLEK